MKPADWKFGATPPAVSSAIETIGDSATSSTTIRSSGVWRVSWARRPNAP